MPFASVPTVVPVTFCEKTLYIYAYVMGNLFYLQDCRSWRKKERH